MIEQSSTCRLLASLAAVFAATAVHVPAQEKTAPAASATAAPAEDAMATARREFEAVKRSRDAALQPKGSLPSMSTPSVDTNALSGGWSPKAPAPEKKSPNWLVEAMEKESDDRNKRSRSGGRGEATNPDERDPLGPRATTLGGRETEGRASDVDRKQSPTVINPLARYLGDWMSPQDYALLRPGIDPAAASGIDLRKEGPGIAGTVANPLGATQPGLASLNANLPRSNGELPRENPYLQSLNAPPIAPPPAVTGPVLSGLTPARPASQRPPAYSPPPLATPAPKPNVPDFLKSASDDKYFKQLKRF